MSDIEIKKLSQEGFNCAQIVLSNFSQELGVDPLIAKKITSCFGGGMGCGETCGAVTGALMVLGLKYGNYMPNTPEAKNKAKEKAVEFKELFLQEYDSTICRELLGYDIANPEERKIIQEKELLNTFCPILIAYAMEILNEVL